MPEPSAIRTVSEKEIACDEVAQVSFLLGGLIRLFVLHIVGCGCQHACDEPGKLWRNCMLLHLNVGDTGVCDLREGDEVIET